MTDQGDLAGLLASGEHAAFHGKPAAAVGVLEQAVVLAQSQGRGAEMAAAGWLLGVALGAGGRYGGALTVLSPLVESGRTPQALPEHRLFAALAASTVASVHRQLGRHAVARASDLEALALTEGTGEAAFDAQLGLASDAVGLDEPEEASSRLQQARALVPARDGEWWRQRVRLGWVEAEVQLLDGQVDEAVATAGAAVDRAEAARAPRHVAKGLLILGIAQVSGGTGADGEGDAAGTLRRAATLAESLGTVPLVWPARALLGALVAEDDPVESDRSLTAARAAVRTIASDLPPGVRAEWLGRPDVAALLEG
ncbi:MAG: hypothetical protein JWN08_3341 [Frankiales bacterium]|nr:hypothetical protein [Frankiales bacterium]